MEDFSKRNMREFVGYISLGIWGMATAATAAHAWNFKEHGFITCAAIVSVIGTIISIVKLAKTVKKEDDGN
jgi:uncharacterized membrane protein YeaQ/YmgE (transglycosylase-associated protein family)